MLKDAINPTLVQVSHTCFAVHMLFVLWVLQSFGAQVVQSCRLAGASYQAPVLQGARSGLF
jgi:hypothetical protein